MASKSVWVQNLDKGHCTFFLEVKDLVSALSAVFLHVTSQSLTSLSFAMCV